MGNAALHLDVIDSGCATSGETWDFERWGHVNHDSKITAMQLQVLSKGAYAIKAISRVLQSGDSEIQRDGHCGLSQWAEGGLFAALDIISAELGEIAEDLVDRAGGHSK